MSPTLHLRGATEFSTAWRTDMVHTLPFRHEVSGADSLFKRCVWCRIAPLCVGSNVVAYRR